MASNAAGAPAPGRRLWLKRLALVAVAVAVPLIACEVLLVRRALPLSEAAARFVYGCYEPSQPSRFIHAKIRPLKVRIHRPDFEADCYFMGYFWRHRSDGFGWRNPETWDSADVVVLGDSIVYGHGVEETQTTTHFLRELLDRRVVNMGITGASPAHYVGLLRNFGLPLEPRVVIVLTFGNDLKDIPKARSPEAVERFITAGQGKETRVLARSTLIEDARAPGDREVRWLDRFALYRLVDYRLRAWKPSPPAPLEETHADLLGAELPEGREPTPPAPEVLDRLESRPSVAYFRRALEVMAESTRAAGADLVVGHIGRRTDDDWLLRRLLEQGAAEHGFRYFDTPMLEGRYRLPGDGHLSEEGHRRLSEALGEYLEERRLLFPPAADAGYTDEPRAVSSVGRAADF